MSKRSEKAPELFSPVRTEHNDTKLYIDGPEILSMLLQEIKKARHYIHIQVMLFYSDEAGYKVADALAEKAQEGVDVRVMSDSGMSNIVRAIEKFRSKGTSDFSDLQKKFSQAGVKFKPSDKESYRFTNWDEKKEKLRERGVPEEFIVMQDAIQDEVQVNTNVFDHRKLIVIDGETAIVMGSNIGNKYLYDTHTDKATDWHDGALLVKGPVVSVLNKQFASKWMVRGGDIIDYQQHYRKKERYGTAVCTVTGFFPGMKINHIRDYYLDKIKNCKGRFIIENPYITDELIWKELSELDKEQAQKIIIINPYKAKGNDFPQNESAIKCRMWEPFRRGVSFYSYQKRMTHWKVALDLANEEVFYGSYNLNHRSALHDFEMNILVESPELAKNVRKMLEKDMAQSTKITHEDEFYQHPKLHPSCLLLDATEYFE